MPHLRTQLTPFARELKVLLVEDEPVSLAMVKAQLKGVFGELILASDGREGLELYRERRPDLVLTDHQMPQMSGLDMTEAIRWLDTKVPIIFITAAMDTSLLVRAINLGISAILPKPIVPANLRQALALAVGMLENDHLQRTNLNQELALLQFREKYHEHQQELAFRKELSLLENDFYCRSLGGTGGGEWIAQAQYFPRDIMCGDSYSLRRIPGGGQLIYLADAMGKGLGASLTTSLGVYTFNLAVDALTDETPFSFRAFVTGYLALMGRRLLEDEVFSLSLVWLPPGEAVLEIAAFGMPPILVAAPGEPVRKVRCNNPPLSPYLAAFQTTVHTLGRATSALLYTDGLNEAPTLDGGLYRDHLEADFQGSPSLAMFWRAFQTRVPAAEDDVTFLLLRRVDAVPVWTERLEVPGRLEGVEEACEAIEGSLEARAALLPGPRAEMMMAVREALLNAYEHGALEIPGALKRRRLEEGTYFDLLMEREQSCDRLITVELSVQSEGGNDLLKVEVKDPGPGFTPPRLAFQEPDSLLLHGRGLLMVKKYTDFFYFNETGNAITLLRIYQGTPNADSAHQTQGTHDHGEHQEHP